jgi:glycyl-tRNA synthetase beta chain
MQKKASQDAQAWFMRRFKEKDIEFEKLDIFITPRRMTVLATGVPPVQDGRVIERKGPSTNAAPEVIAAFAKSCGVAEQELVIQLTDKGSFYFFSKKMNVTVNSEVIGGLIEDFFLDFTWPKSMIWGNYNIRWVRPIRNILCVFDSKILPVKFGHITANATTSAHRFLAPHGLEVRCFSQYSDHLQKNYVILSWQERRKLLLREAHKIAASEGLFLEEDGVLLDEITGLVEYPWVMMGHIDQEFMDIPEVILASSMKRHQKYLLVYDQNKRMAPRFVVITNMPCESGDIISGYEKVLKARLADAKFFWQEDTRKPLENYVPALKHVVFHTKLGSVYDKTVRMMDIAIFLSVWIPHANLKFVKEAAKLCKADLVTLTVGEFPELQGKIGYHAILQRGGNSEVANAIMHHYSPVGSDDSCPTKPVTIAIALADKIDTLGSLFMIGERTTGSKDPLGLRRSAIGIIRLIIENKLHMPLDIILDKTYLTIVKNAPNDTKFEHKDTVIDAIKSFILERFKVMLKGQSIRSDVIEAVMANKKRDDLLSIMYNIISLTDLCQMEHGKRVLFTYKRVDNIINSLSSKRDLSEKEAGFKKIVNNMLIEDEEVKLAQLAEHFKNSVNNAHEEDNLHKLFDIFGGFVEPIEAFFDKVVVNCDDKDIFINRLSLLAKIRKFIKESVDLSFIEF